jgi:phosphoglycerate dehydrogenase-like enzyme
LLIAQLLRYPSAGTKVLNADNIAKMKHGSRIVNIARDKLIDEEALVSALESGQLLAVALGRSLR